MDKKFIFIAAGGLIAIIVLVVVLVSSGQKPTTTATKAKSLTIWDYKNEKSAYDQIITAFQTENNIKVNYVVKDKDSYLNDTVNAIAAGNGPDIWIVPNDVMPQYKDKLVAMPKGLMANASTKKDDLENYSDTFPKIVVSDNVFNGKIYGLPLAIDDLKLFINTEILYQPLQDYRRLHPDEDTSQIQYFVTNGPRNWDDFVTLVRFYSPKKDQKFTFSSVALGTTDNVSYYDDILTLLMMQNGAKMTSDDLTTAQFHTAQNQFSNIQYPGTKALQFYTSFVDPKNLNYTWNSNMPDSIRALAERKTAMIFAYESDISKIKNITPNFNTQTFNVPQIKETNNPINYARYDSLVVTKSSLAPTLGWKFILKASDSTYLNSYLMATKKQTAKSNNYDQNSPILTAQDWYNPDTIKVKQIFKATIDQVNAGGNAQTALDGAGGQITTLLNKLKQTQITP